MEYKIVIKVEDENGKWVTIQPDDIIETCTQDNWLYPGENCYEDYFVLKTRTTKTSRIHYCIKWDDPRLKNLTIYEVNIKWSGGQDGIYCMTHHKYKRGKKCLKPIWYDPNRFFIMESIDKIISGDEFAKWAITDDNGGPATCMI